MEIPFFKPSLPPLPAYTKNLEHIWETKMISNFSFYSSKMEQIIASYLNIDPEHVIVISSADTGLLISISILNIPQNSEIILPSFTFNSTANVVVWNRMIPVFADINKQTLNMDPIDVKKKITGKTKAILATHVFGNPCDINSLRKIAKENNCYLLFDAAHAYGAKYRKNKVGSLADIEVFSFSGTKLATSAEGGVIVTRNKILAQRARMARNFGFTDDYNSQILGLNGKISEFNAALGYLTLPHIDSYVEKRNKVASIYRSELHDVGDLTFQNVDSENTSSYKDFCIMTDKRNRLATYLENHSIHTKKYFYPIHKMDYYSQYKTSLPNTDLVSNHCLCLPIYNDMSTVEIETVIKNIKDFYKKF